MTLALRILVAVLIGWTASTPALADRPLSKYGPNATPINQALQHLRTQPAPDYWALSQFYIPQVTSSDCSLASVTMQVNAIRGVPAGAADRLVTEKALLDAVGSEAWRAETAQDGVGVTWAELVGYVEQSLRSSGIPGARVEAFKPADATPATLERLRAILAENERSDRDIAIIYFNQGVLTGDWDGPHVSPIGAYDPATRRVLVMDVDREWYVPYWSSDEALLQSMLRPTPAEFGPLAGETGGVIRAIRPGPH